MIHHKIEKMLSGGGKLFIFGPEQIHLMKALRDADIDLGQIFMLGEGIWNNRDCLSGVDNTGQQGGVVCFICHIRFKAGFFKYFIYNTP